MAGFDIGGLLSGVVPGVEKGIARGEQYACDFAKMLIYAVGHAKPDEIATLKAVAQEWIKEAGAEVTGVVSMDVVRLLENGGDPFAGSRKMLQDAEAKFGKPG